jgi:glycosyltransferase involved in cell wall biosynthesis
MRVLILHLFDLNLTGGSGTYLRAIHRELNTLGHQVDVVSARIPDRYGCTTHRLPFEFTLTFGPEVRQGERRLDDLDDAEFDALVKRALASIAEGFTGRPIADLVVVNHISLLATVAWRLHQRWDTPYRIISFGTDTDLLRRAPRFVNLLAAPTMAAERVFAISEFIASEIRAVLPVQNVEVLGPAADPRLFYPNTDPDLRRPVITYVGRLVTEKGLWVLLDAMEHIQGVHRLDIIGEGPLYGALQERLARAQPPLPVVLVGPLPQAELRRRLVSSAAVVAPSIWQEPRALTVAEALASGVPVIATAVGGITEMVVDGVNGVIVPPGDAGALAQALQRVVSDGAFVRQLSRNCVEYARIPTYAGIAQRLIADGAGIPS